MDSENSPIDGGVFVSLSLTLPSIKQCKEITMLASILLILVPFLIVAFLPMALGNFFSSTELDEMGICREDPDTSQYSCPVRGSDYIIPNTMVACGNA
jgi:hypothetical protein